MVHVHPDSIMHSNSILMAIASEYFVCLCYSTHFHHSLLCTLLIVDLVTPNSLATWLQFTSGFEHFSLIANTFSLFSFAFLLRSPLSDLPFSTMSSELSACVPRNQCSGLTQLRISHRWHTNIPSGIDPLCNIQLSLCAEYDLLLYLI